jgi:hypothetical protein
LSTDTRSHRRQTRTGDKEVEPEDEDIQKAMKASLADKADKDIIGPDAGAPSGVVRAEENAATASAASAGSAAAAGPGAVVAATAYAGSGVIVLDDLM